MQVQLAFEDKADPVTKQVGERLGIDFAVHWRPTSDNYWGRVKKAHALEVGAALLGARWERDHAKDKKPVLAKALEAAFAGDGAATLGLDPETLARAGAWAPPGMACGAAHHEVSPADANHVGDADQSHAGPASDTESETARVFLTSDSEPSGAKAPRRRASAR